MTNRVFEQAVLGGDLPQLEQALTAGADANANVALPTGDGIRYTSALNAAIVLKEYAIARRLIEAGADPYAEYGERNAATRAVSLTKLRLIDAMVKKKISLDKPDSSYRRLIDTAAGNSTMVMDYLIGKGASVNPSMRDLHDTPPLFRLHDALDQPAMETLLNAGADTKPKDILGGAYCPATELANVLEQNSKDLTLFLKDWRNNAPDPNKLIAYEGTPRATLNRLMGDHRLQELFQPATWKGREVDAMDLLDKIRNITPPYYRASLDDIDLTPLRERLIDAAPDQTHVGRYVRDKNSPRGRE